MCRRSMSNYSWCLDPALYFFLPFALALDMPPFEFAEATLDAREGDVELALLAAADLTLSSALFYISMLIDYCNRGDRMDSDHLP
jgi:hypothetical protein